MTTAAPVTTPPVLCIALTPALQRTLFLDNLRIGEVNRTTQVTISAAGKGVNVARVLRTLTVPVVVAGFLGGASGRTLRSELEGLGVDCRCTETEAPTRLCQTLVDRGAAHITELVEETPLPTADEWQTFIHTYHELLDRVSMVILSGTLMPGAPSDIYRDLAEEARKSSLPVLIDSHQNPLRRAMEASPWLVKLNAGELSNTCDMPTASDQELAVAVRSLMGGSACPVLVTRGAQQSVLVEADGVWTIRPPRIRAVNPIGSGDAFTAGTAYAHLQGADLHEAIRFGIACGTANALTELPAHVHRRDIDRLLAETHPMQPA